MTELPGTTHFLPMERTDLARRELLQTIKAVTASGHTPATTTPSDHSHHGAGGEHSDPLRSVQ